MKLESIKIEKFRHINNVIEFHFGSKLTAIMGKNGLGKSSILGLIGHACTSPSNDKTINNLNFETKYSEIFSFSYPDYDKSGQHQYELTFSHDNQTLFVQVTSYDRREAGQYLGLRLRVQQSLKDDNGIDINKTERKIKLPVIYLGLKRLFPLVQEASSKKDKPALSTEEINFYIKSYNQIMSTDESVIPTHIISRTKNHIAIQTDTYDVHGNSAGQDNLGQILTAIISFKRLRKNLSDEYTGGLLLIDELDATMFPGALFNLLSFLLKQAGELNIQVIFTSHSIDLLTKLQDRNFKHHSRCAYLYKEHGKFRCKDVNAEDVGLLASDLKQEIFNNKTESKPHLRVWTEDAETVIFLTNIAKPVLRNQLSIVKGITFGYENLIQLINKKIPEFKNSLVVLDGDAKTKVNRLKLTNIVCLPSDIRPENLIFNFLNDLDESDEFWGGMGGYSKEYFIKTQPSCLNDRNSMKNWFNNNLEHWGTNGKKVFSRWLQDHQEEAEQFNKELEVVINRLLKQN